MLPRSGWISTNYKKNLHYWKTSVRSVWVIGYISRKDFIFIDENLLPAFQVFQDWNLQAWRPNIIFLGCYSCQEEIWSKVIWFYLLLYFWEVSLSFENHYFEFLRVLFGLIVSFGLSSFLFFIFSKRFKV